MPHDTKLYEPVDALQMTACFISKAGLHVQQKLGEHEQHTTNTLNARSYSWTSGSSCTITHFLKIWVKRPSVHSRVLGSRFPYKASLEIDCTNTTLFSDFIKHTKPHIYHTFKIYQKLVKNSNNMKGLCLSVLGWDKDRMSIHELGMQRDQILIS